MEGYFAGEYSVQNGLEGGSPEEEEGKPVGGS